MVPSLAESLVWRMMEAAWSCSCGASDGWKKQSWSDEGLRVLQLK